MKLISILVILSFKSFGNVSINEWLPSCCTQYLENPECKLKADQFLNQSSLHEDVKAFIYQSEIGIEERFYHVLCNDNWNSSALEYPDLKVYNNGFITIHDAQFFTSSNGDLTKYNIMVDKMESFMKILLLDSELNNDPLYLKDRLQSLYTLYLHKFNNNWAHIGYHFLIGEYSGNVFEARPIKFMGAHAGKPRIYQNINVDPDFGNIGGVFLGNKLQFPDSLNSLQKQSATNLISKYSKLYSINSNNIFYHGFISPTSCGKEIIKKWLLIFNPQLSQISYEDTNEQDQISRTKLIYDHYLENPVSPSMITFESQEYE